MALLEALPGLAFAFSAGAVTFFAPCAYPLLPGYVSYYVGSTADRAGSATATDGAVVAGLATVLGLVAPAPVHRRLARAVVVGVLVSTGFAVVYGLLAGVVATFGARLLAGISVLELGVGVLLVGVGTAMALGAKPSRSVVQLPERRRTNAGYLAFGVLYAAAAAGCTAPIFVAVAVRAFAAGPTRGLAALGAYSAGMSTLMIGVTVLTALGRETVLERVTNRMDAIYRVAGVLLAVAGIAEIYLFLFRYDGLRMLGLQ